MKIGRQKNIFIIDGIGAFLSALSLVFIIIYLEALVGISKTDLSLLAVIALLYSIYSITCYFLDLSDWKKYLKLIAILNIAYCLLTVFFIIQNLSTLTKYGYTYFILELLIIIILVTYEFKIIQSK